MAPPATPHLSKRLVGFLVACALLSLIWYNAGSEGKLRKTYKSLSKQAQQSAASTATAVSVLAGNKELDDDVKPKKITTPPTNISDAQDVDAQIHNVNVTTAPLNISDGQPDVDSQPHKVTILSTNFSSQAPFPLLPPPDDEEYMAICMAGEHLYAYRKSQSSRVLSVHYSERPSHGSS